MGPPRTALDNTAASAARKTALAPGGLLPHSMHLQRHLTEAVQVPVHSAGLIAMRTFLCLGADRAAGLAHPKADRHHAQGSRHPSDMIGTDAGMVTRRFLAEHQMALQIGSTLFVHGGVLPMHAQYGLERINDESRAWMNGSLPNMPSYLAGRSAVVWTRDYSAGMPLPPCISLGAATMLR